MAEWGSGEVKAASTEAAARAIESTSATNGRRSVKDGRRRNEGGSPQVAHNVDPLRKDDTDVTCDKSEVKYSGVSAEVKGTSNGEE